MSQGDGFDGTPGQAGTRLEAIYLRALPQGYALDGVDGRYGIGSAGIGADGGRVDVGNIGRHLGNDRNLHASFDVGSEEGNHLRILSHVAAHARIMHLGAGEVEFNGIAAGLFGHPGQFDPFFFRITHDGGNDHFARILLFETLEKGKVHLHGILAQLFHVPETEEIPVTTLIVYRIETRRHFPDFFQADGLVIHASPAGLEGTRHHVIVGADSRRRQEKRILAMDAAEIDGQGRPMIILRRRRQRLGDFPDADGTVIMDTSLLGSFQFGFRCVL